MLKHQKTGLLKAISMLLALVLMVTMLPVMASAGAIPAFDDGYPKLGTAQADGSKKIQILVKGILPDGVTEMGVGYVLVANNDPAPTAEQIKSSFGKIPGVTVITWGTQLLGGIETTITLTGAQDDTDYDFYAVSWKDDTLSEVKQLDVKTPAADPANPDPPTLAPPTGLQWDTADGIKAKWNEVANATSYAVTLWEEGRTTMVLQYPAITGTQVDFQSNLSGRTSCYFFTVQAIADGYVPSLKPASPIYPYISPLYGTATIDKMSPIVGDTLTGSLVGGNNTGTLHYAWKAGESPVGVDAASYTVTAADLGRTITLEITSSVETGTRTSAATTAVGEAPQECIVPGCTDAHGAGILTGFTMIGDEAYYHISSPEQLAHISEHLGLNYIQTADIDLSQYNEGVWTPIGGESGDGAFSGQYLGDGKKITGLTLNLESADESTLYGGLFGLTDAFAHIEGIDLTIEDLSAVLTSSEATGDIYLGGIAAVHASAYTIKDCHVMISGDITAENTTPYGNVFVGGLTGYNSGYITDCSTKTSEAGNITVAANNNEAFVGGIAGYTQGSISSSDHIGKLHVEAADETKTSRIYVGGIAGYASDFFTDTVIENCQNNGDIESLNNCDDDASYRAYAGGIVGHIDWDGPSEVFIKNCANIGTDKRVYTEAPSTMTGGIAGSSRFIDRASITIINCYNRSDVISQMVDFGGKKYLGLNKGSELCTGVTAGGIIGAAGGMQVSYSYCAASNVEATAQPGEDDFTGGLAGLIWETKFAENYYESKENVNIGIGGAVTAGAVQYGGLVSGSEVSLASMPIWDILPIDDVDGEVEGAAAAQLKTKSFFGTGWKWYNSGGIAPDYYSAATPWRFTVANSYPVLRGLPYTAPTSPSSGGGSSTTYMITATANEGGTITPAGYSSVTENRNITFTIKPDKGFLVKDVLVDGVSVGAVTTYTFSSAKADHRIEAVFAHDCPSKPYTDVDITQWYHKEIDYVLLAGLYNGTSAATFEPNAPMTRGMLVTVLHRLEGSPAATTVNPFTDVASGKWYTDAVTWASGKGIVIGYDADTFGPEDPITREQMAAILYRYVGYKGLDVSIGEDTNILSYKDALIISEYAIPAIRWACGAGIMQGDGVKLDPQGNATRAQVAAMLMRLIENIFKD